MAAKEIILTDKWHHVTICSTFSLISFTVLCYWLNIYYNPYLSHQSYFKDGWNMFDFVTVVGSIVDALMVEFAVSYCFDYTEEKK